VDHRRPRDVARQDGTERRFQNEYWDNKEPGLYVDVVSGEPQRATEEAAQSKTVRRRKQYPDIVVVCGSLVSPRGEEPESDGT
jgi:hypothetical protein